MKRERKYDDYLILRCNGEWEKLRVPRMFNAAEVAKHRSHSLVFLYLPKKYHVWLEKAPAYNHVFGPGWVLWSDKAGGFVRCYDDPRKIDERELYAAA